MSRSSPSAPHYLHTAILRVEALLREVHPEALTAREIAERLAAEGYEWPLPAGYFRSNGRTAYRTKDWGPTTTERVRRVCELKHGRTRISVAKPYTRPRRYTIYEWAL